jgi:hypothetical protein
VAEGGGLLNRYAGLTRIVSSNLIPSAITLAHAIDYTLEFGLTLISTPISTPKGALIRIGGPSPDQGTVGHSAGTIC